MRSRNAAIAGASLLLAVIVLGVLVVVLPAEQSTLLDRTWNSWMSHVRQPWMLSIAYALNSIGGGLLATFVVPAVFIVSLVLLRRWRAAVFTASAFLTSALVVQVLKQIFGRARPDDMLVASDFGSFPSGHTANAATIAVVLWVIAPRAWVAILGVVWTVLMALSRTVLSVHWLTDTVGGALAGGGAALLVVAVFSRWASIGWSDPLPGKEERPVSQIRPYRPSDRDALYEVCVRTADAGQDATGIFTDDRLWGDVFAVPYAERDAGLAWVVESGDGRVIGYILGTDDTDAFETWFRDEWWPTASARHPLSGDPARARQDRTIAYAAGRAPGKEPNAAEYPAHLHIDLLPETQGQGLGRQLMETLLDELRRRGVPALHLGMDPANTGALAFYERLGFERLPAPAGTLTLGIRL